MPVLERFVGERFNIDDAAYEIVGYHVEDRDVVMLATKMTPPHRRVELSLPQVLRALFDEPLPQAANGAEAIARSRPKFGPST